MAYDEELAQRIRQCLHNHDSVTERKMFGGLAFMVGGNMLCGVVKNELMVRVGPNAHDDALLKPGARPMEFTGRPMRGMLFVDPSFLATQADLSAWVDQTLAYASSLPVKEAGKPAATRAKKGRST